MSPALQNLITRARREADRLDVETNARFEGVSTEAATLLRQLADRVEKLEAAASRTAAALERTAIVCPKQLAADLRAVFGIPQDARP